MSRKRNRVRHQSNRMRRGIFLVPSLFTTAGMVAGMYALLASVNGLHYKAGAGIFIAMILDGLDGRIARWTSSSTPFGKEYDSLSDLMAFGVAPAVLLYSWALRPFGRIGWVGVFLFVICGALRLARFNIQSESDDRDRFRGLPIPVAAGIVAASVMLVEHFSLYASPPALAAAVLAYVLAFLMVSNLSYPDFKRIGWKDRKPFNLLVGSVLILVVVATFPHITVLLGLSLYALLGPVDGILHFFRRNRERDVTERAANPTNP